jgi:purine-binding chemotaxis protein CheW
MSSTHQFCTFTLHDFTFGIEVQAIQEVILYQAMTAVPLAPSTVRGLINLRGQIVTAIDLRYRLGLSTRAADVMPMNVVLRSRNEVVSLLVDDIGEVIDTAGAPIEPVPSTLPAAVRDVLTGVIALPAAILLVLDGDRTADLPTSPPNPKGNP